MAMLKRLSSAIRTGLTELDAAAAAASDGAAGSQQPKFPYTRPHFLSLSLELSEVQSLTGYNVSRPILVAGDKSPLPGMAGYAESINGGKSQRNEDQAQVCQFWLRPASSSSSSSSSAAANGDAAAAYAVDAVNSNSSNNNSSDGVVYAKFVCQQEDYATAAEANRAGATLVTYFALFDGHAGDGAAVYARHRLQLHVRERLQQVHHLLLAAAAAPQKPPAAAATAAASSAAGAMPFEPSLDELVIGALETAFIVLDEEIRRERRHHKIKGGCTALVTLFLLGRVYIANAGDTRAVLCRRDGSSRALTTDQTPHNDRQRIQSVADHHPELLGREFCPLQFARRLSRRDLGRRVLYRHARLQGWCYKSVTDEDLLFPLITGDDKKSRLLATIGVARGFGDHDLMVSDTSLQVKPFLSCVPQVTVLGDASVAAELGDTGCSEAFIVMATDGLWDVLSNEAAGALVQDVMGQAASNHCVVAAQSLVGAARGTWIKARSSRPGGGGSGGGGASGGGCWRLSAPAAAGASDVISPTSSSSTASLDDISCFVIPLARVASIAGLVGAD